MTTFSDLGVPEVLVRALAAQEIITPFPIQVATLPDTLRGADVLGRGRTGSGKTLAFALPVVARLAASTTQRRPRRPRALVLCPTRELATQIDATFAPLARAAGLRTTTVFGGVAQSRQVTALDRGVDVLVACPGRLEDLLRQNLVTLDGVEITVLDEADHMADLGFLPVVRRLLDRTPTLGQRLLFSATLDNGVGTLVDRYLTSPVEHAVDPAAQTAVASTHHVLEVADAAAKKAVVETLAAGSGRRVLFMRTKHHAKKLAKQLTLAGIPAVDLHGNLGQGARERNLAAFSSGEARVLVATDIAARGIHVDEVELVVHVDPPAEHKAYLHRSGRTARAGASGTVLTIQLPEQRGDVRAMTRAAGIRVTPVAVAPGDALVRRLADAPGTVPADNGGTPAPTTTVAVRADDSATAGPGRTGGQRTGGQRTSGQRAGGQRDAGRDRSRARTGSTHVGAPDSHAGGRGRSAQDPAARTAGQGDGTARRRAGTRAATRPAGPAVVWTSGGPDASRSPESRPPAPAVGREAADAPGGSRRRRGGRGRRRSGASNPAA
ncbi:DEAD/DEAH box helicase domain protein [Cellulomonas flavigena DSM 20109]|uniref:DEAD/DEAH box helicase domain protein n=1 Tax=Cellulomonas flavigena (strain ATCC 482 / DSM 20109 / BCRC 11376 / JCM 18109 / NBRC 3775 / NCIMB 8073 / NRS 134) TaxID=446466 RepID=D5UGN6_CELFN|nr:DEAD/DEAH box helicase [Cellulomonas flavigena]ADG75134.1 DEAD/DEAH box helicase domain protein [Cellulomonas flavigena DSM 20109]